MKKIIATLAASATLIGAAYAGSAEGVIKTYDAATHTVTMEDGTSYVLAEGLTVEGLAAGAKVKVTFDDGSTNATAVEVMN